MRRIRTFKKKKNTPKGYDSGLEYDLHKSVLKEWEHHTDKVEYVSRHKYQPDFVRHTDEGRLLVEVKGRFRTSAEAKKYIDVRECLPEGSELIFIFQDAKKPMPFSKKRKDGTKFTHGEWAEKFSFRYYCFTKGLPKEIT